MQTSVSSFRIGAIAFIGKQFIKFKPFRRTVLRQDQIKCRLTVC